MQRYKKNLTFARLEHIFYKMNASAILSQSFHNAIILHIACYNN